MPKKKKTQLEKAIKLKPGAKLSGGIAKPLVRGPIVHSGSEQKTKVEPKKD